MRILWISDTPTAFTGYGTVTREILGRLVRAGYDVSCVGWGYQGWPYDHQAIPYDIYPSEPRMFGREVVPRIIQQKRPDVVVAFGDAWMIEWLKDLRLRQPYKLVVYFPVDGRPFPQPWTALLRAAHARVTYSRFGEREARAACPDVPIDMIYHGVDVDVFRPLGDKRAQQAARGIEGKFVVGCIARNQPRKQFPILARAFAKFAKECEEAMLLLHTDPQDTAGWDLMSLVQAYGLERRLLLSVQAGLFSGVAPEELNRIYNVMDVMALPTMGEGFGLPIVEAMAAGVPVIATRCSSCEELIEGRGEGIEVKAYVPVGRQFIELAVPDADDLAAKLRLLYDDPERRVRHSAAGIEFAAQFHWERIMGQWQELFARFS